MALPLRVRRRRPHPAQVSRSRVLLPGLALLAVLATAPFGGLKTAAVPPPEPLGLGQDLDLGPFTVRVEQVLSVPRVELAGGLEIEPASARGRLLLVEVRARNTTDEPQSSLQVAKAIGGPRAAVEPWPGDQDIRGDIVGVADATRAGYVNPGLTLHALVIFSQPATWTAATIDLSLSGSRFREDDPFSLEPQAWVLDDVLARGPLPVTVRT